MIRTLRNSGVGQLVLGAIVTAIILAFVLTGASPGNTAATDECVVEVGTTCIGLKEYEAALRLSTSIGISEKAIKSLNLRQRIAQGLAERSVLAEEAARLGVGTSEDEIDNELFDGRTRVSLPAKGAERLAMSMGMCIDGPRGCAPGTIGLRAINVRQDGKFDFALYKRSVRISTGRSPQQFKEMQQLEYTAERVRQLIRSTVQVSADEAFLSYSRARSEATARTVAVKSEWFQSYITSATQDEVDAWSKENKEAIDKAVEEAQAGWKPGCSVVSEIRLDNADPSSEESEATKKSAEKLLLRAKMREDFGKLARESSQGESSHLGGRLGCLDQGYGSGATVLIEAANELSKAGDLSPVIETIKGFHILRLIGRVTDENRDSLLRAHVSYKLASQSLANEAAKSFAAQLIKDIQAGSALEAATEALTQKTLAESSLGEENPGKDADSAPKMEISRAITIEQSPISDSVPEVSPGILLFGLEKEDDIVAEPIATESGFAVMQLKSKEMITREKFDEERVEITQVLQKRKAEEALNAHISDLIKKAGGVKINSTFVPNGDDKKSDDKKSDDKKSGDKKSEGKDN